MIGSKVSPQKQLLRDFDFQPQRPYSGWTPNNRKQRLWGVRWSAGPCGVPLAKREEQGVASSFGYIDSGILGPGGPSPPGRIIAPGHSGPTDSSPVRAAWLGVRGGGNRVGGFTDEPCPLDTRRSFTNDYDRLNSMVPQRFIEALEQQREAGQSYGGEGPRLNLGGPSRAVEAGGPRTRPRSNVLIPWGRSLAVDELSTPAQRHGPRSPFPISTSPGNLELNSALYYVDKCCRSSKSGKAVLENSTVGRHLEG